MLQCSCGWRAHLGCLPQTSAWSRRVRPRLHPARLSPHLKMGWTMRCSFLIWHEQRWAPPGATHLAERSPAAPSGSCGGGGWRRACRLDTGGKNASNVREGGKRRNRWLWNIVAPLKWTALRQICLTLDTFSVPSLPPSLLFFSFPSLCGCTVYPDLAAIGNRDQHSDWFLQRQGRDQGNAAAT